MYNTIKNARTRLAQLSEREWLFLIVILGCLIRLAAIVAYPHQPESDELAYIAMAENLVAGKGLLDVSLNAAMYNAGYPLFILAPIFLTFGKNFLVLKLVNILLGVVSILLCHAVAKEAGAGKRGRLLAALMWAVYLPAGLYTVYVAKENLLTPCMLGVMWCALRFRMQLKPGIALTCGFLLGLIGLVGNAGLVLVVPTLFSLLYRRRPSRACIRTLLLIALSSGVVISPWLARNQNVLGAAVLNTNGGFNLYLGNNPAATGNFVSIADTPRGSTWEELRTTGEFRASDTLKQEAIAWIRSHPGSFASLALKKLGLFWTVPLHDGKGKTSIAEHIIRLCWAFQYLLLAGLVVASLLRRNLINEHTAVIWLALAAYTGVHMLFYVILRYREPVMPLVCVLAALSAEKLFRAYTPSRGDKPLAIALAP
jgi:hypothetical protein